MKHRIVNSLVLAIVLLGIVFGFALPQPTYASTFEVRTTASTDDVRCGWDVGGGNWAGYTATGYLNAGRIDASYTKRGSGMRFQNVTIPQGATITTAYLQFTCETANTADTVVTVIIGNDVDDAATFANLADYQARRGVVVGGANDNYITAASVGWSITADWSVDESGADTTSPEIKTIIQEIVNRAGWTSGNDMVIFWDDHAGASTAANEVRRQAYSYDDSAAKAPLLHIEYTTPLPTVTTDAADDIEDTTATLNGNVTDDGGLTINYYGFVWDTVADAGDPANTDPSTPPAGWEFGWKSAAGDYGENPFDHAVASLPTGTTIYFRAAAHNAFGWAYGAGGSFLTKPAAPTNISATDGTETSKVVITWTKSTGATNYHVWRDAVDLGAAGDVATFDDNGAAASVISEGVASACDGCSSLHCTLSIAGDSVANGTTYTYKVVASNASGDSDDSLTNDGYRGHGALTYEWFRSGADADGGYGSISGEGGTTDPYNDPNGGIDPDGRWYYCHLTATGCVAKDTNHNRGYIATVVMPTITTLKWSGVGKNWAILYGEVTADGDNPITSVGFDYGITTGCGTHSTITGVYVAGNTFWITLRNLTPATVYYFRAQATNIDGITYGGVMTFSTIGSPIRYEELTTGGDADGDETCSGNWTAQTFTVGAVSHTTTSARIYIKRDGLPSTITVSLQHATSDHPTGADIASATLNGSLIPTTLTWYEFTWLDSSGNQIEPSLAASQQYALVMRAPAGDATNSVYWYWDSGGGEPNGKACFSSDGGISWTERDADDYYFEIWGNPALQVLDAKIIKNFITTGDWLVVAKVANSYEPYASEYSDPSRYFRLQLVTNTGVAKGVVPWVDYGKKPLSIYLSPTIASTMTWGDTTLTVRAYLSATETADYNLVAVDWLPSVTLLDSWVIVTAQDLEDYDNATYLIKTADKGLVLNDAGGTIFKRGIANLDAIRPNLFQVAVVGTDYTKRTYTHAGETGIVWSDRTGVYFSDLIIDAGGLFGISGQNMFTFIMFVIFFGLTLPMFAKGHGIAALILSAPFVVIMWYFGSLSVGIIAVVASLVIIGVAYEMWWKTT